MLKCWNCWDHVECFWERDIMLNGYRIQRRKQMQKKDNDDTNGNQELD